MVDLQRSLDEHVAVALSVRETLLPLAAVAGAAIAASIERGGRLYALGTGGDAATAAHFAAELIGRPGAERRPLPAVALAADPSVVTGIGDAFAFDAVFARQLDALADPADVVVAFSTSGASESVRRGLRVARERGATTILMTGEGTGQAEPVDLVLAVPSTVPARVQEIHALLVHLIGEWLDAWAAGAPDPAPGEVGRIEISGSALGRAAERSGRQTVGR